MPFARKSSKKIPLARQSFFYSLAHSPRRRRIGSVPTLYDPLLIVPLLCYSKKWYFSHAKFLTFKKNPHQDMQTTPLPWRFQICNHRPSRLAKTLLRCTLLQHGAYFFYTYLLKRRSTSKHFDLFHFLTYDNYRNFSPINASQQPVHLYFSISGTLQHFIHTLHTLHILYWYSWFTLYRDNYRNLLPINAFPFMETQ